MGIVFWVFILLTAVLILALGVFALLNRTNGAIRSGGRTRRFLLYVPDSYNPEQPSPLVISIHGFVQWPAHQRGLSGWNRLADENGFLVVYPRGTGFPLRWNAGPIVDDLKGSEREVDFFIELIEDLSQKYNIDRNRIYANGMSNGGGMTHLLACKLGDRIAAFGGVAGAYLYPGDCYQPTRKAPWIAFHGINDPVVPYQGGSSRHRQAEIQFQPVESWAARWAEYNGCELNPEVEQLSSAVTRISYKNCQKEAEVIFYRIAGAGHTWPGGGWLPVWLTGITNRELDATALMWEFFQRHTLNG